MAKRSLKYRVKLWLSERIPCDEAAFLVSKGQDGKLSFKERWELKVHLYSCKICRKYQHDIDSLQSYFEKKYQKISEDKFNLNPDQKQRIREAMENKIKEK